MKLIADSQGRLTAAELFRPGRTFEASLMPDGSIRIVEMLEKTVPTVEMTFHHDGSMVCSQRVSREGILGSLRSDRDSQ